MRLSLSLWRPGTVLINGILFSVVARLCLAVKVGQSD
eukprot:SAG22_NODE_13221_length_414_cov_0.803175_1_plen_36_part_10